MVNNSEQFNSGSSSGFTDDAIHRFLLGQLSVAEQLTFEVGLLEDDSLETRVRLAEYELTDNYAFERLQLPARKLFEQNFLLSFERKRKLIVSKALRKRFASVSAAVSFEEKTTLGERLVVLFNFTQPRRRLAFRVVILLLSIGILWLAIKAPRIREKFIARRPPTVTPAPVISPRVSHHASPALSHHETISPMPSPEQPDSATNPEPTLTIVLFPANSLETGPLPFISIPYPDHEIVRLELLIKPNQAGTFRAELLTIDGQYVFSAPALKADTAGSKTYLDVSAALLKTDEYQIKLSRSDGSGELVERYYFRVQ